jgi:methylmalonyl-CoA/ethylmalonyl-CoA epimerase
MDAVMEKMPGLLSIDHVAIAVRPGELEAEIAVYRMMGFSQVHREEVRGNDQVREVLLQAGSDHRIQLLEPLSADSPVSRQLENSVDRGRIAHIAFRVTDIGEAFTYLKANGFAVIDAAPRAGSRGTTVFFVHPKTTEAAQLGYLMEFVQV